MNEDKSTLLETARSVLRSYLMPLLPVTHSERVLLSIVALGNIASCMNIRGFFDVHHRQPTSSAISLISEVLGLLSIVGLTYYERLTLPNTGIDRPVPASMASRFTTASNRMAGASPQSVPSRRIVHSSPRFPAFRTASSPLNLEEE